MNKIIMASLTHYGAETGHPEDVLSPGSWNPDTVNGNSIVLLRLRCVRLTHRYDLNLMALSHQSLGKSFEDEFSATNMRVIVGKYIKDAHVRIPGP
jgi:hypothetical protein